MAGTTGVGPAFLLMDQPARQSVRRNKGMAANLASTVVGALLDSAPPLELDSAMMTSSECCTLLRLVLSAAQATRQCEEKACQKLILANIVTRNGVKL